MASYRSSVMFRLEGMDGAEPRMVARAELVAIFAQMAAFDLRHARDDLRLEDNSGENYLDMEAGDLHRLLEIHTRCTQALTALLSLRHPEELVEMHMNHG